MIIEGATTQREVVEICHERWLRRKTWRDERFDDEFRRLVDDERRRPERPVPVVEHESSVGTDSIVANTDWVWSQTPPV